MSRSSSRACSRWRRASTSRGISAAAFVGAVPVLQSYGYAHVGADATGFIDLYKGNRVLMVRGTFATASGAAGHRLSRAPTPREPRTADARPPMRVHVHVEDASRVLGVIRIEH